MLKPSFWLLLLVTLYSVAHLTWYLGTPLGQSPVLDGQENLLLADQIADGTLAKEPFYRAMLYPALLALLPLHWSVLGLAAHVVNTLLAYRIAHRLWNHSYGALLAGALVGFNPVLLHFAFDPLDITLATTFFLGAIASLQSGNLPNRSYGASVVSMGWAGLLFALAALARPHFFAALIALSAVALIAPLFRRIDFRQSLAFLGAAALPLFAYGMVQKSWSGSFGVLPWQGAYNLWISNKPGATGLYYQQSIEFHRLGEHRNPNRLESEQLYSQETGEAGDIDSRGDYWRSKTLQHIRSQPGEWLELMLFKTYALFNSYEQYNNKTYAFHKALSPWLRYNPISWGVLLILATIPAVGLWRQQRAELLALLFISATFSAGILIYMASARFRIPLVPILAVIAGGLPLAISALRSSSRALQAKTAIATALIAALTFSTFGNIAVRDTQVQDALLLADASARVGDDLGAIKWASQALEMDPSRQSARRLRLISKYNLAASGAVKPDQRYWEDMVVELLGIELSDARLGFVRGVVLWNLGSAREAIGIWKSTYESKGIDASASLAALLTVAPSSARFPNAPDTIQAIAAGGHPLLGAAMARQLPAEQRTQFLRTIGMDLETFYHIEESLQRVLPKS